MGGKAVPAGGASGKRESRRLQRPGVLSEYVTFAAERYEAGFFLKMQQAIGFRLFSVPDVIQAGGSGITQYCPVGIVKAAYISHAVYIDEHCREK